MNYKKGRTLQLLKVFKISETLKKRMEIDFFFFFSPKFNILSRRTMHFDTERTINVLFNGE